MADHPQPLVVHQGRKNVSTQSADIFSALSQAMGTKFDGILGFDFLSKFKIEIDYPNERLRLEEQINAR